MAASAVIRPAPEAGGAPPPKTALLRAVGDVALIGCAADALIAGGDDAWRAAAAFLAEADVALANFEMPIVRPGSAPVEPDVSPDLAGRAEALDAFLEAGIDVVSLANNHIMDWGEVGLFDTVESLRKKGVATFGAGRDLEEALEPAVLVRNGLRIGFVGFTPEQRWTARDGVPGAAPLRLDLVRDSLSRMRGVDVRVVSLHWGIEMSSYPTPGDRRLARAIAEAGADLIVGHHPHVIQGKETIGRTPVVYSMGNFLFDIQAGRIKHGFNPWDLCAGYAIETHLTVSGAGPVTAVPTLLSDSCLGTLADGEERDRIAAHIDDVSRNMEGGSADVWRHAGDRLVGHKMKVIRANVRDGGILFTLRQLANVRPRHLKMLLGFVASRLRRRA
jgi:poly-gamma-glutamate capsule biosynthesis protein CapA/YwtB (metallophosphatase superfamily)